MAQHDATVSQPPFFLCVFPGFFLGFFFSDLGGDAKNPPKKKIFFRRCKQGFRLSSWKIFPKPRRYVQKGVKIFRAPRKKARSFHVNT